MTAAGHMRLGLYALAVLALTGCERCQDDLPCDTPDCAPAATPYTLEIPPFFPPMDIPEDNPLTVEGIELGRMLFWEKELSADGTMSCGSCHLPSAGFSDPNPYSTGITGAQGFRNAMAIINIGWSPTFFGTDAPLHSKSKFLSRSLTPMKWRCHGVRRLSACKIRRIMPLGLRWPSVMT